MADHNDTLDSRPKESDFDPYNGCLDAQCAWKNFGGLSVTEAFTKFCDRPEIYQEDFMFMGGAAFSYYFPVIERYVRESHAHADNGYDVEAMWILAHCIKQQFDYRNTQHVESLRTRVLDLITHVRNNLSQYCREMADQRHVDSAWADLHAKLTSAENAG